MNGTFLEALASFSASFAPHRELEQRVMHERDALAQAMRHSLAATKVANSNPLLELHELVRGQLESAIAGWAHDWDEAAPMRRLAEEFSDRIVLLVYGKVNAGKSSFCNLFVDLNQTLGSAAFFGIEHSNRVPLDDKFIEGVTETTSRIQGVELGDKLVLLDSPGLHSVNDGNGALTRRYTDSADAVLWLTPSSSPGQVQELDDLIEEIKRNKPLLPVISRSDRFIENEDPVTGDFVRLLYPKAPDVRRLQEDDVAKRTRQALDHAGLSVDALRPPLSVSTMYYKRNVDVANAAQSAGLDRLFATLTQIVGEAATYKKRKADQMMRNYLDGAVLRRLTEHIEPEVHKLREQTAQQERELEEKKFSLASEVLAELLIRLPDLIEAYKAARDTKGLAQRLTRELGELVSATARRELERYVAHVDAVMVELAQDDLGQFKERTVAVQQQGGRIWKAASAAAGAAGGAELGTLLLPGIGTAIGAVLGGFLGSWGGSALESSETIHLPVGVSGDEVQVKCEQLLRLQTPRVVAKAVDQCIDAIRPMQIYAARLEADIDDFKLRIASIKEQHE